MQLVNMIKQFARDEEGVVAIEYGLLAAFVAIALVTVGGVLDTRIPQLFSTLMTDLDTIAGSIVP
ncbi:Flp family type IVb pilin [Leptothrix sp. BB-4]